MKKIFKYAGIGLLALMVLVLIAGKGSTSKSGGGSSNGSSGTQAEQSQEPAGLNEEVQDEDLAFTVLKVSTAETLGNQYTRKTAQGLFYIATLKIENKGNKTVSFDSSMAKVTDEQGREFDRSIDGQTAKGLSEGQVDLFLQQIQPGLSVTGDLVFDLPESIETADLILKGGLFSDGVKVRIH